MAAANPPRAAGLAAPDSRRREPAYDPPVPDLTPAVQTVVRRCLQVAPGENVVVVVDAETHRIGEALRDEAGAAQADAVLAVMDARAEDGTEPPPTVAAALAACDVFVAPTSRSLSHTMARKQASEAGAR